MGKAKYCEINNPMPASVPELQRKKQERNARLADVAAKAKVARAAEVKQLKADWLARGKAHHEEWNAEQRRVVDAKRTAQAEGNVFVPAQPKVLLVVRVKGINKVAPKQKLILRLLRLRQIHNAVFVRVNKATLNMLQRIQPYVTYGYPNRKTVESLVYKRGYGKVAGQRTRLSNNFIVEENLNKHGCMCMEDVIEQVLNVGPAFKQVNNFLWPFKLSSPKGGLVRKTKPFLSGGDFGSREHEINAFVRRML